MTLIEFIGLVYGQPGAVHLVKNNIERVDSALEKGGMADVKVITCLLECLSASSSLSSTSIGKIYVGPAGEKIELIPLTLTMTHNNQLHVLLF